MSKAKEITIENTIKFVKKELENAEGGHDWFHIERVFKNAILIAKEEDVDVYINGNQVTETTPAQIIQEGERRREEILIAAQEHRQRILSQTTLR